MFAAWLAPTMRRVAPTTMLRPRQLLLLGELVSQVLHRGLQGDFAECGVWRGGSSFLIADVLRRRGDPRPVWMFDSFAGMPPVAEIDGRAALDWTLNTDDLRYRDNATATLDEVMAYAERLDLTRAVRMVEGWFEDTLPAAREEVGPLALLRIDCDWHSSVTTVLENLYDQVVPGGVVIIDDYCYFDGCAIAVHEFLGKRRLPHRIMVTASNAFFWKT